MTPRARWVAGVLALALVGAIAYGRVFMGAPREDIEQLTAFLLTSGVSSLVLGALLVRWIGPRLSSLRLRLMLAYSVGLIVVLVNVLMTSALMFLSPHDLALLVALLVFATALSLAFGYSVAIGLTEQLGVLNGVAGRLASGDLSARVRAQGSDEVARLAAAFDHMAEQLQSAFTRERALEAGRREMVAAVSHDLRTPLATTRAMVEALVDGVVSEPDEVQRYLRLVRGEVEHLGRLIDDLGELSQIESGELELHLAPTHLTELLAQTLDAYQARAEEQGVSLEHVEDAPLPPIPADASRFQRVVRNLVDNALRFTPAGGRIRVQARLNGEVALVSVSDTGDGVAPDELERVFDRFYRGEAARSRGRAPDGRAVGAGLGLAIARGLVQAHGGRIWAEPTKGGGATFHFTLPLTAAETPDQ